MMLSPEDTREQGLWQLLRAERLPGARWAMLVVARPGRLGRAASPGWRLIARPRCPGC